MDTILIKKPSVGQVVILDLLLLGAAILIPAASHLFTFPLYQLNPMLLILLTGMLMVQDRRNAFLLAVLLPLASCLATGMPSPMKAFCMGAELSTVVLAYTLLSRFTKGNSKKVCVAIAAAMFLGKVVFYTLEALIIAPDVLVNTSMIKQTIVCLSMSIAFSWIDSIITNHNGR